MPVVYLYLVTLMIAPQLWLPPFVGLPTDYICFPLLLIAVFMSGRSHDLFRLYTPDLFMVALVVWITLSAAANGWTPASQAQVIFYWKMLVLYKLTSTILGTVERTRRMTTFFCLLVLVLGVEAIQHKLSESGIGWAGQTTGWIDPEAIKAGEHGRARWIGIFGGPGVFAVLFSMGVAFPLVLLRKEVPKAKRYFAATCAALMLWALYCTGSRGGLLACVAVIGVYVMIRANFSKRTIVIAGTVLFLLYSIAPSYLTTVRDQSNSSQYRVEMWAAGLDMIKGNPLFGVGIHNFQQYSGRLIGHNSAVELMAETGLIGLALWVSLIYICAKGVILYREATQNEDEKWYCLAVLLCLLGYIGSAMFVTLEYETIYLLLAWCAVIGRRATEPAAYTWRDAGNVGKIVVGWVIGLQVFVIAYLG